MEVSGGSLLFVIDRTRYAEAWCFRFKNVYDMPETLTATGGLKMAGNNESDMAAMYGVDRKFGVKVTDEYTVTAGVYSSKAIISCGITCLIVRKLAFLLIMSGCRL